jgi:hypothetical protein
MGGVTRATAPEPIWRMGGFTSRTAPPLFFGTRFVFIAFVAAISDSIVAPVVAFGLVPALFGFADRLARGFPERIARGRDRRDQTASNGLSGGQICRPGLLLIEEKSANGMGPGGLYEMIFDGNVDQGGPWNAAQTVFVEIVLKNGGDAGQTVASFYLRRRTASRPGSGAAKSRGRTTAAGPPATRRWRHAQRPAPRDGSWRSP